MLKFEMAKQIKRINMRTPFLQNLLIILGSTLLVFLGVFFFGFKRQEPEKLVDFGCPCSDLSGALDYFAKTAVFEGEEIGIPEVAFANDERKVLSVAQEERWIEVNLSEQKLRAWEGDELFLETPVSTGLPWWPTPTGEFRIWVKLRATRMEGGTGNYYYNLPNVPYVMFIKNNEIPSWRGYGLHGTYWHNDFGIPRSHGCVNLPTPVAKELYFWTGPFLPEGKTSVFAADSNPGSRVVIHN